jgi:hypothetical protein
MRSSRTGVLNARELKQYEWGLSINDMVHVPSIIIICPLIQNLLMGRTHAQANNITP